METDDRLSDTQCIPCQGGIDPLNSDEIEKLAKQISPKWNIIDNHHLEREYKFENFTQALDFTNRIAVIAEFQRHHPDILLKWGLVKITLYTHKINGLDTNDFILASKIDKL